MYLGKIDRDDPFNNRFNGIKMDTQKIKILDVFKKIIWQIKYPNMLHLYSPEFIKWGILTRTLGI